MPRPLKRGILSASTIILTKDIDKYSFMSGSNFYESDVMSSYVKKFLYSKLEKYIAGPRTV